MPALSSLSWGCLHDEFVFRRAMFALHLCHVQLFFDRNTPSQDIIMEYHAVPPEERAQDDKGNPLPWGYVYKECVTRHCRPWGRTNLCLYLFRR